MTSCKSSAKIKRVNSETLQDAHSSSIIIFAYICLDTHSKDMQWRYWRLDERPSVFAAVVGKCSYMILWMTRVIQVEECT